MATAKRGGRGGRGSSSGGRRSTPPPTNDDLTSLHLKDEETNMRESRSRRRSGDKVSSYGNSEDIYDGTTKHNPSGDPNTSPSTTHSTTHPTTLTSGHIICRKPISSTTTTPPKRTYREEEEEIGQLLKEEAEKRKRLTTNTTTSTTTTTTKRPPHHHHHHHNHHQGPAPMLLILVCLLILALIYSLHQTLTKIKEEKDAQKKIKPIAEVYEALKFELQSLNREFSQSREVWLGILGQLESVMVESPPQPAVLLLVVPEDSQGAATCLAHHLANAVQDAFEDRRFVMFDTRTSHHLGDVGALKVELDATLGGLGQSHAAVVHNIESLPGQAAMILHAYCDNENAPFKQAVIFLLANVPGKYEDIAFSRIDKLVDGHLLEAWGGGDKEEEEDEENGGGGGGGGGGVGLKEKDVSALISRTANAPLLIRPERAAKMMELCAV